MRRRLEAYARHHSIDLMDVPIQVIDGAPNLLTTLDTAEIGTSVKAMGGADLIILDTLAQATPGGNENSSEDMGLALANCKTLAKATTATVLLVHHSGKDASRGARGWSGIKGALDAEIEVSRGTATR